MKKQIRKAHKIRARKIKVARRLRFKKELARRVVKEKRKTDLLVTV